jgi:DNA-binding NarL/FixJ family response regulator
MVAPATLLLAHSLPHVIMMWRAALGPHIGRYHIGGEAATIKQVLHAAAALQPAVILMDAGMAGKRLAAAVKQLRACAANVRLLICWQYCHDHLVQPIPGMPVAYLAEDASLPEILIALNLLMCGDSYHCRQTERLFNPPARATPLSPKHRHLLWYMREGRPAKETAMVIGVKVSTVNGYIKDLHALIGSSSMVALESFMRKEGML